MQQNTIEREANPVTGKMGYVIYVGAKRMSSHYHSVLACLEAIESPEHPLEALAYTTLGEGCSVPTNKQLAAARDGRDAMHAEIRQAEDNSWSWK
jgi:hypothetical protein